MDRNRAINGKINIKTASHPAGGAWIEIFKGLILKIGKMVAPRRGCVDRNSFWPWLGGYAEASHPAGGAWIEIRGWHERQRAAAGRTPQGVRG